MSLVLITGGGGSLGAELASALSKRGYTVRVFDLPGLDYSALVKTPGIEVCCGNITDKASLHEAMRSVDCVLHLAALLPPATEKDRARTEAVNVGGTKNLMEAVRAQNSEAHFIFSSSVAVYGDTTMEGNPLMPGRELRPCDFYSRSKAMAEELVTTSGLHYTVLRISGVAIPAFLEPPSTWPFTRLQRIEFISRSDVVTALRNCVGNRAVWGRVFNIAGGTSWQVKGHQYVEALFDLMGVPHEEAHYLDRPGWLDWYYTSDSNTSLGYQQTTFPDFLQKIEQAVKQMMG